MASMMRRAAAGLASMLLAATLVGPAAAQPRKPPKPAPTVAPPSEEEITRARKEAIDEARREKVEKAIAAEIEEEIEKDLRATLEKDLPEDLKPEVRAAIERKREKELQDRQEAEAAEAKERKLKRCRRLVIEGGLGASDETTRAARSDCFDAAMGPGTTSGPGALVGADVLRSVAQIVVNRTTRVGWTILRDTLESTAGCRAAQTRFPATCKVLGTVPIRDLVASPFVLLHATVADFFIQASGKLPFGAIPEIAADSIEGAAVQWNHGELLGLADAFHASILEHLKAKTMASTCASLPSRGDRALWVAGMCVMETQNTRDMSGCDVERWTSQCGGGEATRDRIAQVMTLARRVLAQIKDREPDLADSIELTFLVADQSLEGAAAGSAGAALDPRKIEAREYLAGMKVAFLGLNGKDWVQTTSGAVRVIRAIHRTQAVCAAEPEGVACVDAHNTEKLFTLLAAVGNYAETFDSNVKDTAAGAAAREKIIDDLVDRMVNRTDRTSGVVVSLGGNLGLVGGARTDFSSGAQIAFPIQLGIGVGLDSYGEGAGGFHGMLTAIDLGQYVTIQNDDLVVDDPAIESSVMLGLTLGGWFALRETPYYVGVFGGMSPFVRANDEMTYELGLVTGLYVPLLDLN
jgi:hypothetical protein